MTIDEMLWGWVGATPDAVAVSATGRTLSYADLGRRAGELAGELRAAGLAPGGIVELELREPVELIIGMAGTVLAGGAYLAIDADLPARRREQLVAAARPQVRVDERGVAGGGDPTRPRPSTEDDLAAVYFTSGSSGQPKGVPLRHRGVTRLFRGAPPMDLRPGQRMAHTAYPMFDATTLEVWGPLLQGATIVVLPRTAVLDPATLRRTYAEHRVDVAFLTTALFRAVAGRAPDTFADLDTLYIGGEAVDRASVAAVFAAGAPRRLRNLYGPTETTTLATWYEVDADTPAPVPIGRAVPATATYVLDNALQPTPPGLIGELYVAGDGLGPGYLGQPGATARRYRPDPFSGRSGARMYRTGDLVRQRPDGNLEFHGRADRQVKLRGYRIELDEIEACLAGHPRIRAGTVALADQPARLVAHVAADDLDADAVRTFLAERLPAYMVPATVVVLAELPVTAGGKLDRAALALDGQADTSPQGTDIEERVAAVWATVLGRAGVERTRNFFDAGGTSLLLMEVQAGLAQAFGTTPGIDELIAHPTVAAQAGLLAGATDGIDQPAPVVRDRAWLRRRRAALAQRGGDSAGGAHE